MRRHNNLATRYAFRERHFLTERQFLRSAHCLEDDMMAKREMIYAKFEALEEQLAHCYFQLHTHFIVNPPLAKVWAETAMEELQHSSMLRFCRERGFMA